MKFIELLTSKTVNGATLTAFANAMPKEQIYYLIAGVHGDEPEGVYVLQQLFSWLQKLELDVSIIVVPVLNLDGLSNKTRVNANGVDLNRNWPTKTWTNSYTQSRYCPGPNPLSEPENIFLAELFTKYKPHMIISFHSLRPLLDHNQLALNDAKYLNKFNNYELTTDIGYPTPGSLGSYVDEALQCGIITYELPVVTNGLALDQIWQANELALTNYFKNFAGNSIAI